MKLKDLAKQFNVEFTGDGELEITHASGLEDLKQGGIAYLTDPEGLGSVPVPRGAFKQKKIAEGENTAEVALIVSPNMPDSGHHMIYAEDPLDMHVQVTKLLHPEPELEDNVHTTAVVAKSAKIGKNVKIGANVVIYDKVNIGANTIIHPGVVIMTGVTVAEDCKIYPNVVIREECQIGKRVILQPGAIIGSDGHGYYQRKGENKKIPQVGRVILHDDVEVGACTAVDRGRFNDTVVHQGTKLDNLVQVAHNVEIGAHSLISGQSGIGGSTKTGRNLILGGQAAVRDNIVIGDQVVVAGRAGVSNNLKDKEVVGGAPAQPVHKWMQGIALVNNLADLFKRVKILESKIK